jgi:hypothetical protein
MCLTLGELKTACAAFTEHFDAALVAPAQLRQVLDDAGAIEKMMATVASLTAARMAATGPTATAPRRAAHELARASGTSVGQAMKSLESGKALASQPAVAAAARAGQLSRQQAALVTDATSANP